MPLRCTIDHEARRVHVAAEGMVTAAEIRDYLERLAADGAIPYAKLFDLSAAQGGLNGEDFAMLGRTVRGFVFAGLGPLGPLAIVAGESQVRLQAARFADAAVSNRPLRIFDDRAQAEAWLDEQMLPRQAAG